jgi:23S rRNA (adenine2503-C2)-methyltransferase
VSTRYDLTRDELASVLDGEPRYRLDQLWDGLYTQLADPADITNLPKALRARLDRELPLALRLVTESVSDRGDTVKFLWELDGGSRIETVLMLYPNRATVCVSSQAGCAMGCGFCATGQAGFTRHLTVGEIVEQVVRAAQRARAVGRRVSNIVFMGMGEPMANLDAVWAATERFHGDLGLSARHITISTVGVVPGIRSLRDRPLPVNLAVSLHAANDTLRDELVPINRRYPIDDLLAACDDYLRVKHRRVSFEWAMISGVNDRDSDARELAALCRRLSPHAHVNLIPLNPTPGYPTTGSSRQRVEEFRDLLEALGANATVRRNRGTDIDAACGQLAAGQPVTLTTRRRCLRQGSDPWCNSRVGGVGDGEFVCDGSREDGSDLVGAIVEPAGPDGGREFGVVGHAEPGEALAMRCLLGRAELDLALDHAQHVRRHAGVETQPAVGGRDHLVVDPLTNGFEQLHGVRGVVGGGHVTTAPRAPGRDRARSRRPDDRSLPARGCGRRPRGARWPGRCT